VRVAATIAPLALLATSCGGSKVDPYAKSLAMGSEHVEFHSSFAQGGKRVDASGYGDFTNNPDRGRLNILTGSDSSSFDEVFANGRIYVDTFGEWVSGKVHGNTPQTPAEMFRAHLPARIENGVVRSITVSSKGGSATYVFSKYGEPVSITIPRVKGSK
jgi:hypothetical protein